MSLYSGTAASVFASSAGAAASSVFLPPLQDVK
jgi:hypothetical protein